MFCNNIIQIVINCYTLFIYLFINYLYFILYFYLFMGGLRFGISVTPETRQAKCYTANWCLTFALHIDRNENFTKVKCQCVNVCRTKNKHTKLNKYSTNLIFESTCLCSARFSPTSSASLIDPCFIFMHVWWKNWNIQMTVLICVHKWCRWQWCRLPPAQSLRGPDPSDHGSVETTSPPNLCKNPGCF